MVARLDNAPRPWDGGGLLRFLPHLFFGFEMPWSKSHSDVWFVGGTTYPCSSLKGRRNCARFPHPPLTTKKPPTCSSHLNSPNHPPQPPPHDPLLGNMARTSGKRIAKINLKPYTRHLHSCCSAGNQKMRVLGLGDAQFVEKDRKKRYESGDECSGEYCGVPESFTDVETPDDSDEESDSAASVVESTPSPNQVERLVAPCLCDGYASSHGYREPISAGPPPSTGNSSLFYPSPAPVPAGGGPGFGPFTTAGQPFPGVHPFTVGEPTITGPSSIPLSAPVPTYPFFGNPPDFLSAPQVPDYLNATPMLPPLTVETGTFPYGFTTLPAESPCTRWTTPGFVNQGHSVGQNSNLFSFNGVDTVVPGFPLWNTNAPQAFDYVRQPTTAPSSAFPSPITPTAIPAVPEQPTNDVDNQGRCPPKPRAAATPPTADSDKCSMLDGVQNTLEDVSSRQPGAGDKSLQGKLVKVRCYDMWFSEES